MNKRSQIREYLDISLVGEKVNYYDGTEKKIIEETRKKVITNQNDLKQLGKEVEIQGILEEESKVFFYVIVDQDVYEVSLEGAKYIGGKIHEDIELEEGDITFSYTPSEWTNGNVSVKISVKKQIENYALEYKTEETNWRRYSGEIEVEKNGTIYARLAGALGQTSVATGTVANIDKLPPNEFTPTATSTTNSITVTANVTDAEKTSDNGSSGISGYRFSQDNGSTWTSYQTSGSYTFNNLTQNTNYNIKVETKDKAGNTRQASISKGTEGVTSGTETGAITFSTVAWSGGKASTTISTNTSYTIQYQINSTTGTWLNGTNVTGRVHGDIIYARLWDGTNGGDYATLNIKDTTAPTATISAGTVSSSKSVVLTASGTDTQSGVKSYEIYVNGSRVSSSTSYTITNMPFNTNYSCYSKVTDVAGNVKQSSTITVKNEQYVSDATDLVNFRVAVNGGNNFSGKTITQTANINLSSVCSASTGVSWVPIGTNGKKFAGIYNGNRKTISGIYINTTNIYQGLFGVISSTSVIQNVGLAGGNIKGGYCVGGIVALSYGSIVNCYNHATIIGVVNSGGNGNAHIGGIVGIIGGDNKNITGCYNSGTITSDKGTSVQNNAAIGGIVGYSIANGVTINSCYNKGKITAISTNESWASGIFTGGNNCSVINSYNIGTVSATGRKIRELQIWNK